MIVRDFVDRPPRSLVERFASLSKTDLSGIVARALDALGIMGTIPASELHSILPGRFVAGPALTIRNIPVREVPYRGWNEAMPSLMREREAFFLLEPGDVAFVDGGSVYPASCLGSIAVTVAGRLGAAGVVVAGAVTGVPGIRSAGYPVWARSGTTLTGHHRLETVEVNAPIGVCGVRIDPGDIVVADDSGISVVPVASAERVLELISRLADSGRAVRHLLDAELDREALRKELRAFMSSLQGITSKQ